MSSTAFDSDCDEEIHILSTLDHNSTSNTSLTSLLNDSASSSSNSYTPEQSKRILLRKKSKFSS